MLKKILVASAVAIAVMVPMSAARADVRIGVGIGLPCSPADLTITTTLRITARLSACTSPPLRCMSPRPPRRSPTTSRLRHGAATCRRPRCPSSRRSVRAAEPAATAGLCAAGSGCPRIGTRSIRERASIKIDSETERPTPTRNNGRGRSAVSEVRSDRSTSTLLTRRARSSTAFRLVGITLIDPDIADRQIVYARVLVAEHFAAEDLRPVGELLLLILPGLHVPTMAPGWLLRVHGRGRQLCAPRSHGQRAVLADEHQIAVRLVAEDLDAVALRVLAEGLLIRLADREVQAVQPRRGLLLVLRLRPPRR